MKSLSHLFDNNRAWSERLRRNDPEFFPRLSRQQRPRYLWIGCADSRVPANEIVGLLPGELFVHRNVANVVVHSDLNCLSVMQFAVDVLQGRAHHRLRPLRLQRRARPRCGTSASASPTTGCATSRTCTRSTMPRVAAMHDTPQRVDRLCELNVIEQVANVCQTTVVRDAWDRGQALAVHGWVYGLTDGLVRDLRTTVSNSGEASATYRAALEAL